MGAEQLSPMLEALSPQSHMMRFSVQQLRSEWKEDTGEPVSDQDAEAHSDMENRPK